ncbi:Uncharacterised protein [Bartonella vinsonii]|uniref:Uncharacterized protein n=1 Tax=Bartonella vinsonii TaxID=33047 RepID=A0A3S5A067_BARVI|nr:Uncharacterised protein [Bartonella vinsonii]
MTFKDLKKIEKLKIGPVHSGPKTLIAIVF